MECHLRRGSDEVHIHRCDGLMHVSDPIVARFAAIVNDSLSTIRLCDEETFHESPLARP